MSMIADMRRWILAQMEERLLRSGITSRGVDAAYVRGNIASGSVTVGGSPIAGAHALVGSQHTASGLTTGHVLTATSATAFAFQAPATGVRKYRQFTYIVTGGAFSFLHDNNGNPVTVDLETFA